MRSVGAILSFFCGVISIGLLGVGYIGVFEETQVIPDYESTPREGWDYWMRLELWHDIRSYSLWIMLALGGVLIPIFGVVRRGLPLSTRKVTDWILFCISGLYFAFWSWGLAIRLRVPDLDWFLVPLSTMFAGCLYGLLVFWKRARHRIDEEAQQAVDGNPH